MENHKLKNDNVVSIGHNSNRSISAEAVADVKHQLKKIQSLISNACKFHTASHGDEYYFKDEISNEKDLEKYPGTKTQYGLFRRPNPYEKKRFAADTERNLDTAAGDLAKIIYKTMSEVDDNE